MKKLLFAVYLGAIIIGTTVLAMAATISENDSTQPRDRLGAPVGEGIRVSAQFDGKIMPTEDSKNPYYEWVESIIANAMRDPAFFATLDVANQNFINFINSLDTADREAFLAANKLPADTNDNDLCQRCHKPVDWRKDFSEPPIPVF